MKAEQSAAAHNGYPGYSARDDIAIRAMIAILRTGQPIGTETLAERSYQVADAMIRQSEKE